VPRSSPESLRDLLKANLFSGHRVDGRWDLIIKIRQKAGGQVEDLRFQEAGIFEIAGWNIL